MGADGYEFKALRPGETEHTCVKCGKPYQPTTRTQKYCPDCKKADKPKPRNNERRVRRKRLVMEARKKMDNNTFALNDALFRELERIEGCENPDEIEQEAVRADKVCNLASAIISNGRLMLTAAQMQVGVAESVNVPKALLGNGDGK